MERDKLIQRLMATFLGELEEHVRSLNQDLLALERESAPDARAQRLKTLFRTAHSLKGAARSVSVSLIEEACHHLEDILSRLQEGQLEVTPDLVQLFFATADGIAESGKRLREKQELKGAKLEGLTVRLRSATGLPAASSPLPAPSPVPVPTPEPGADPWVRIPAARLDELLRQSGELLVARRRSETRDAELAALQEHVGHWKGEWKRTKKALRDQQDQASWGESVGPETSKSTGPSSSLSHVLERTEGNLRKLESDLERLRMGVAGDHRALEQTAGSLEEGLRRVRMLPFSQACESFDRTVRDLGKSAGKDLDLRVEGGEVELDRMILEQLKDPLLHLIRNAADHGVEPPAERTRLGKPSRGRILIKAGLQGSRVEISVEDDGRGIDLARIREQARKKKIPEPTDRDALARLIFLPGFSTSPIITEFSGRGVGLDVVKSRIESLHGTVAFSFEPAQGTRFILTVPLTLTTVRALLVGAAGQVFAIVGTHVRKLVRAGPEGLSSVQGREVLLGQESPVPLVSLAQVLSLAPNEPRRVGGKLSVAILASGDREAAFAVDELHAEQEVVIKPLGPRLRGQRSFSGATVLPSGRVALILSTSDLVDRALSVSSGGKLLASFAAPAPQAAKRLLVVDDSVTTRSLERSILEAAGYEVLSAVDGQEAWGILQEKGADLVVADVEMPRMDGFTLAQTIRASKRFRDLPVVLVTALGSERDKAKGIEVGADAYLVKSAFDQRSLLETVARLL